MRSRERAGSHYTFITQMKWSEYTILLVLILVFHSSQLLLITLFLSVELEQLQVESEREKGLLRFVGFSML
uniref:Putative ovule protein n=1 Tax=Solanum chacoense TaxID=4108 RepID=A0A0V0GH32_SOLCH